MYRYLSVLLIGITWLVLSGCGSKTTEVLVEREVIIPKPPIELTIYAELPEVPADNATGNDVAVYIMRLHNCAVDREDVLNALIDWLVKRAETEE